MCLYMKLMGAFDNWILYHYLHLVDFPFTYFQSLEKTFLKKHLWWNIFSKELLFSRSNINFQTNLSAEQADLQFQISNQE